ncbi:MAG: crotonase/enoyl-CoA hydratase family protein [Marinicaulis sp.]|nr:crotonase/enoyl-CoA hydratase family protein [Marinicaulis sp.]
MTDLVTYSLNNGVATIAMDDGKANALSHAMFDELGPAFDRAEKDGAVVILTGREGMFSGGFDLPEMMKGMDEAKKLTARGSRLGRRILSFQKPVIGASSGHAIAMGAFLMLCCDYRISADGPFKTGLNETAIGIPLHNFGIELARHRLPRRYFNRCVMNAEIFAPSDAVTAGFYDQIAPASELRSTAASVAEKLKQLKMNAFALTKNNARKAFIELIDRCIEDDLNAEWSF